MPYPSSRRLHVGDVLTMTRRADRRLAAVRVEVCVLSVQDKEEMQEVVASGKGVGSVRLYWGPVAGMGSATGGFVFSYLRSGTPAGWRSMSEAPRDATHIRVIDKHHRTFLAHWAEDLSGECQPPFRGWFRPFTIGAGYYEVAEPVGWLPIPPAGAVPP